MTTVDDPISDAEYDRYLIRGELRERRRQFRGRDEAVSLTRALVALKGWNDARPAPRGEVLIDLGFRLRDRPRTAVDIPLALISAGTDAANPGDVSWINGRPELAVEIVNRREPYPAILERVEEYQRCEVPIVWLIDPRRLVRVYRNGRRPETFAVADALTGGTEVPGLSVPVRDLFR
jgi:hypothetical protein